MKNLHITCASEACGNLREFMERTRLARPERRFEERETMEVSPTVSPRTVMLLAASLVAEYAPSLAPKVARSGVQSSNVNDREDQS